MATKIEMEALPSANEVDNLLADLTRVFVIEIRKQTTHASGTAITEEYNETIQWSLPKAIMVKLMKIGHMWYHSNMANVYFRFAAEVFLNDEVFETDIGVDGVLDEINDLFLRGGDMHASTGGQCEPWERNWEPGKVLPKNEVNISLENAFTGTEAYASIGTQIVHIHYQLFKFSETESDNLVWDKSTTTE